MQRSKGRTGQAGPGQRRRACRRSHQAAPPWQSCNPASRVRGWDSVHVLSLLKVRLSLARPASVLVLMQGQALTSSGGDSVVSAKSMAIAGSTGFCECAAAGREKVVVAGLAGARGHFPCFTRAKSSQQSTTLNFPLRPCHFKCTWSRKGLPVFRCLWYIEQASGRTGYSGGVGRCLAPSLQRGRHHRSWLRTFPLPNARPKILAISAGDATWLSPVWPLTDGTHSQSLRSLSASRPIQEVAKLHEHKCLRWQHC